MPMRHAPRDGDNRLWKLARPLALVGAGIGVAVQGTAPFLLDLILASAIARG